MKKLLVLDDNPKRHQWYRDYYQGWQYSAAHDAAEAVGLMRERPFDLISLDHDLGKSATGTDVAKWMAKVMGHPRYPRPPVVIHSLNEVGAARMARILKDAGFQVMIAPFPPGY